MTRRIFSTLLLLSLYNEAQQIATKTIPVLAVDSLYIHSVILSKSMFSGGRQFSLICVPFVQGDG